MHRRSFGCPPRWMRSPTSALLGAAWREDLACDDNRNLPRDRTTLEGLTHFFWEPSSRSADPLNRNVIASALEER